MRDWSILAALLVALSVPSPLSAIVRPVEPAFLETIGSLDLNYCVVTKDSASRYRILRKNDSFGADSRILGVGPNTATVRRPDGATRRLTVPHEGIPADIFLMGLATVYQRSIVVGGRSETLAPFHEALLTDPAKLQDFCSSRGLDMRIYDDCIVIRRGRLPPDIRPFDSSNERTGCDIDLIRVPTKDAIEELLKLNPLARAPLTANGEVSVKAFGIAPNALLYYIDKATSPFPND